MESPHPTPVSQEVETFPRHPLTNQINPNVYEAAVGVKVHHLESRLHVGLVVTGSGE